MSNTTPQAPEPYDPCVVYDDLRQKYLAAVSGTGIKRVRHRNGEEERETDFAAANPAALRQLMEEMKAECDKAMGIPSGRFAMGFGYAGRGGFVR